MSTISSQDIISIIKSEIEDYDSRVAEEQEVGTVIWVGDGIAIVYGILHSLFAQAHFVYLQNMAIKLKLRIII